MRDGDAKNLPAEASEIFQPARDTLPKPMTGKQMTARNMHLFTEKQVRARQNRFIQTIRAGGSVTRACTIAKISRSVFQKWLEDPAFKTRFSWARDAITDYLEELALLRAEEDNKVLIELLRANRPEKFARGSGGGSDNAVNVVINAHFGQPQDDMKEIEVKVADGEDD